MIRNKTLAIAALAFAIVGVTVTSSVAQPVMSNNAPNPVMGAFSGLAAGETATVAYAPLANSSESFAIFKGELDPDHYREHVYTVSAGSWTITAVNLQVGDLDIKVYDEDGDLIAFDTLADNVPQVRIRLTYKQTIRVRVINSSRSRLADYVGSIE
ncbi:MAG: hypothetical protein K1X67_00365 [Fimbriimonadaceae bacterium]|nr:hypothetical protein [Fimbriimonadaceae bacterium]